nr:MAG TPA: hypothetical protein [Caudoviricetes sp.]
MKLTFRREFYSCLFFISASIIGRDTLRLF